MRQRAPARRPRKHELVANQSELRYAAVVAAIQKSKWIDSVGGSDATHTAATVGTTRFACARSRPPTMRRGVSLSPDDRADRAIALATE
jgi:hypothetical protein